MVLEFKNCHGCYSYGPYNGDGFDLCSIMRLNNRGECPCTKCVVKMMCGNPCDSFHKFRDRALAKERYDRRYEL